GEGLSAGESEVSGTVDQNCAVQFQSVADEKARQLSGYVNVAVNSHAIESTGNIVDADNFCGISGGYCSALNGGAIKGDALAQENLSCRLDDGASEKHSFISHKTLE